jgi:hypothetical protein
MGGKRLTPKQRYFLAVGRFVIFLGFWGVFLLGGTIVTSGRDKYFVAIVAALFAVVACLLFAVRMTIRTRNAFDVLNYPRIRHLRIAGQYKSVGASKLGISPLHLGQ